MGLTVMTVFCGTPTLRVKVRCTARSTLSAWMMMVHVPEDIWLYVTAHVDSSCPPLDVVPTVEHSYSWPLGDISTGVTESSAQPVSWSATLEYVAQGGSLPWNREVKVNGEFEVASIRYEPPLV